MLEDTCARGSGVIMFLAFFSLDLMQHFFRCLVSKCCSVAVHFFFSFCHVCSVCSDIVWASYNLRLACATVSNTGAAHSTVSALQRATPTASLVCLGCLRLVLHVCGTYVRLALPARKCAVSMATDHMSERWRKDEGPSQVENVVTELGFSGGPYFLSSQAVGWSLD